LNRTPALPVAEEVPMSIYRKYSALLLMILPLALALVACGGGSSSTTSTSPISQPAAETTVQVALGDSPADWITTFGMNVNAIRLTNNNGGTVDVLPTQTPMEMLQLMGTVHPVSIVKVPQGTYTRATVEFSSVQMGYLDPATHQYKQKTMAGPFAGTVNFDPPLKLGSTSTSLNLDMNVGESVSINNDNVSVTPKFTATMAQLGSGQDPWHGWVRYMIGSVTSTSGSRFTTRSMLGLQNATFTTDSNTQFVGLGGVGMMGNGEVVAITGRTQADGSMLATRVESMWVPGGMMGGGIVADIVGNPPAQLELIANNGINGGMTMSAVSGEITVNVASSTPYSINSDGVDLTSLPFTPAFDSSNIAKGQRVDVISGGSIASGGGGGGKRSGVMAGVTPVGTINASQVRLQEQGIHGVVSNYSENGTQATFTLTLPSDSAFATLTGISTITVYKQSGTQLYNVSAIADGDQLCVRGLLFNDSGTYKLVASRIIAP
jgi:Domain of unknown function (DUF5666)